MSLSLYEAVIPGWLQILGSLDGLINKGEAFATDNNLLPDDLIQARIYEDMLPFAYQVKSCYVHSAGAIEGARSGSFSPDSTTPPANWDGLRAKVQAARELLLAIEGSELEDLAARETCFAFKGRVIYRFTTQNFLLSFSNPNFMFHATTAYDILRMKGVPLVKRDYLGKLQVIPA